MPPFGIFRIPSSRAQPLIWKLVAGWLVLILLTECGTPVPSPTLPLETAPAVERTPVAASPQKTATPTLKPVPTLDVDPAALRGKTIRFWHPWSGRTAQAIEASIERFNTENEYGITVQATNHGNYDDLYTAVDAAIQSRETPQLTVGYNYQVSNWSAQGPVVNLNNYVSDPQWGLSEAEQADFFPVIWEQDLVAGERIGFPAQRSAQVMIYNQSWAEEIGYDEPPATPEEFQEQACAAVRAKKLDDDPANDSQGGWIINTAPATFLTWLYAFDGQALSPQQDSYHFNTPQSEQATAFLKALFDAGCAWPDNDEYPLPEFANRQGLFATLPLSDLTALAAEFERSENDDQWTVIGFPSERTQPMITIYGPSFVLFGASPEEQLASWLLVKWLASPEEQASLIAASGTLPLRAATQDLLKPYGAANPQWTAAVGLLPAARTEPNLASWSVVRWVLGDVATQVFRYYFTTDRIPATLELLDETAAELHARYP